MKRARILSMAGLVFLACSGPADLTGEVSVTGTPVAIARGGDADIVLLRPGDAFAAEWDRVAREFQARRVRAAAAATESERLQGQANADRSAALESAQRMLQARSEQGRHEVDWKSYDQALQRQSAALEQLLRAGRRVRRAQSQLDQLELRFQAEAWDLVSRHQALSVRTGAGGRFEFKGIRPGRYLVAGRLPAGGRHLYWLVPVDLASGGQHTVALTESNAGWPLPDAVAPFGR